MKKLFLSIAFVFTAGIMMNVNSSNLKATETIKVTEIVNCASYARGIILNAAAEYNLDISRGGAHYELMMEAYHAIYADCYYN
ncbi:MAG: hypothetical protein GKR88_13320 [Flavobacteriaceae bacterium]|nr:MAG: hypothetical protein GKR88_13320 [Flavobacteriaceae bacterium]